MITTIQCRHCGGPIEADAQELNRAVDCPHCNQKTFLQAPMKPIGVAGYTKSETEPQAQQSQVKGSTIACTYVLAFLMPLAGFFAGIYLLFKKEHGHGICCIALSVIVFALLFALLN